jgi:GNAT superfamily N-acetyltransferase
VEDIIIIEKPDWVSWDDIHEVLWKAHEQNRKKGINMTHYQWPVEKICEFLGENGVVIVALKDKKVIGTAAIAEKYGKNWYADGRYAYNCFACVLPEYTGKGIYRQLCNKREEIAKSRNYVSMVFDTHVKNAYVQNVNKQNDFRYVKYFHAHDHYCVVMAKWVNGCPYTKLYCYYRYQKSRLKAVLSATLFHK